VKRLHARLAGRGRTVPRCALGLVLLLSGCTPAAPSASTAPSVEIPPPATSSPSAAPIDTTNWTVYNSKQYGFSIKHPPGWAVTPAEHAWTLKADANEDHNTGQDGFVSAAGDVRVTVWSTPARVVPETLEGVATWVEKYCQQRDEPCPGIRDRAVPLCNGRDCHPGLLLQTPGQEFRAFFTGGEHGGQMVGVAVWREEWDSSVAKYGGARRLLEGFLSGMGVCPARPDKTPPGCP